jgi:hypothetical protein
MSGSFRAIEDASVPQVTIKTGIVAADGQEEVLTEYLCDWPGCANVAELVVGVVAGLRAMFVVCHNHSALLHKRAPNSGTG